MCIVCVCAHARVGTGRLARHWLRVLSVRACAQAGCHSYHCAFHSAMRGRSLARSSSWFSERKVAREVDEGSRTLDLWVTKVQVQVAGLLVFYTC